MIKKNIASRLTKQVEIEQPVKTPDGGGGFTLSWANFATVWAEIEPLRGRESFEDLRLQAEKNFRITIRYVSGVEDNMRIKFGTRLFNIRTILNPMEENEILEILAEEGVAQ